MRFPTVILPVLFCAISCTPQQKPDTKLISKTEMPALASQPTPVVTPDPVNKPKNEVKTVEKKMERIAPQRSAGKKIENRHTVTGWVERVKVGADETKMKARIDTGAETSSIDAEVIKVFKRKGQRRVLFYLDSDDGSKLLFESKLVRFVKIKAKNGKFIRRPVVFMQVCLGGLMIKGEVNLAERGHMNYPMLIGRNMMEDRFIVNPSETYMTEPNCKAKAKSS